MNRKTKADDLVTRAILREELEKELENYPTKVEMSLAFEESERRTDEKARQYRDEILTKMDQIVSELAQIREDRVFEKHEQRELHEEVDDHEVRIKMLEHSSSHS